MSLSAAPAIVLDTNVVLDCHVFHDRSCHALMAAFAAGRLRWIATAAMRAELAHVLACGRFTAWQPDEPALWAAWTTQCIELGEPALRGPMGRLRCTDPDDQKFVELAIAASARWLLSHDRAVLALARPLRELGITVQTPAEWAEHWTLASP